MRSWIMNRQRQVRNQSTTFQFNGPVVLGALAIAWSLASCCGAETVEPALEPGQEEQWCFARGTWHWVKGILEQQDADRGSVAILRDPAFSDCTLDFEFNVKPVGSGVRAAAACFRATGTLTYYWLHLDTKNNNVILVRSTPSNTWNEILRRSHPLDDDTWNRATIVCRGPEISVSINGTQVLKATDTALAAGRVGLGTSQGHVQFRNVRIEGTVQDQFKPLADEKASSPTGSSRAVRRPAPTRRFPTPAGWPMGTSLPCSTPATGMSRCPTTRGPMAAESARSAPATKAARGPSLSFCTTTTSTTAIRTSPR